MPCIRSLVEHSFSLTASTQPTAYTPTFLLDRLIAKTKADVAATWNADFLSWPQYPRRNWPVDVAPRLRDGAIAYLYKDVPVSTVVKFDRAFSGM